MQIDSDDDVQQVQDAEMIGNINEIIGINSSVKKDEEGTKPAGKTSIMTTSTGKTLKRKHDDDVVKFDSDDVCVINDDIQEKKKFAAENLAADTKSEITITPISKVSEEKTNVKELDTPAISV